jgi:acetolactate synthase I/II/III large subunit
MSKSKKPSVGRRGFLKGAAAGAALAATAPVSKAQSPQQSGRPAAAAPPSAAQSAAERGAPAAADSQLIERPGSDYMADVIKSLNIDYFIANPGSSYRSLHESLVNYNGNKPEFITCNHEEIAAAMCNGYAKIEGKPAMTAAHGTVGCQHAAMAVYNAYCDGVPMLFLLGNMANATERRGYVEWLHSVQDAAAMIRDYTKWDDNPQSLTHWGESMVRAYEITMASPQMPVAIVTDAQIQEEPIPAHERNLRIPKASVPRPPAVDQSSINEVARMLVNAENPVIVAGRMARSAAGLQSLIELAELLQCAVIDQHRRMNFPTRHPLDQSRNARTYVTQADVLLGLEVWDFFGVLNAFGNGMDNSTRKITKPDAKLISINANDLFFKSNYQNFQRHPEVDMNLSGDAESSLPSLIDACRKLITADRQRAMQARGAKLAEASKKSLEDARLAASYGWDASPISTARMSMELWNQIKNEDWSLVSDTFWVSNWPLRLWDMKKHYHYIGGAGGEGVGYLAGATVGAALANKKYGRISVSIQSDGDLMYSPGALWTAAHHRIPILILMHNNRAYHQEVMLVQRMANQHNRGVENCGIGTTITDPNIDYAKLADSMGVESIGPVSDPSKLGPAIARGLQVVKSGRPFLIDVVTQGR